MARPYDLTKMNADEYGFLVDAGPDWNSKVIDSNKLASQISFLDPAHWAPPKSPVASVGMLDKLPLEVTYFILEGPCLSAIMRLRATNSHLKSIIEQWAPFRDIMLHGKTTFKALVATCASALWTAPQLASVIFTDRCALCGDLGVFLQLLKLKRCCFRCLANDRRLHAIPLKVAIDPKGMNVSKDEINEDLNKIPRLLTIPRNSFWGQEQRLWYIMMLDYTSALKYSRTEALTGCSSSTPVPTILRKRAANKKDRADYHSLHRLPSPNISAPIESLELRFLTAVYAPPLTRTTTTVPVTTTDSTPPTSGAPPIQKPTKTITRHHPHSCLSCRYFWNMHNPAASSASSSLSGHWTEHRLYTKPEMDAHLETCLYSRLRWTELLYPILPHGSSVTAIDPIRTLQILSNRYHVYFPRVDRPYGGGGGGGPAADFEMMPDLFLAYFCANDQMGGYGDDLIEESQSMWCTARRGTDRLRRHWNVMCARRRRLNQGQPEMRKVWGLDRI